MDIAMGLLGGTVAGLGTAIAEGAPKIIEKLAETPAIPKTEASKPVSAGTALIREKIEAGREIMKMMEEQQRQNLEYARQFAELAKSVGWPTK
jgi:hypothetical protein